MMNGRTSIYPSGATYQDDGAYKDHGVDWVVQRSGDFTLDMIYTLGRARSDDMLSYYYSYYHHSSCTIPRPGCDHRRVTVQTDRSHAATGERLRGGALK